MSMLVVVTLFLFFRGLINLTWSYALFISLDSQTESQKIHRSWKSQYVIPRFHLVFVSFGDVDIC